MPAAALQKSARALVCVAPWLAALAVAAPCASAHPLGNRSVNHLTYVKVFEDRVSLLYVLDQAEVPTTAELRRMSARALFLAKVDEASRRLVVTVDGRRQSLTPGAAPTLRFRPGAANLPTVRISIPLVARVRRPRRVQVRDETFAGRLGVVLIVPRPAQGTAVRRIDGPVDDPSRALRLLPPDGRYEDRTATLAVAPGAGTVTGSGKRRAVAARPFRPPKGEDGFTRLFRRASSGQGVFALLLAAAFAWGALHALSPGHGKGMVAAYLLGARGDARHAVALGAIVTVTHTAGCSRWVW